MTKEEIIDNIARLNSETWRDTEEVRAEIGKLLAELRQALEQSTSDDCVSRQALINSYNVIETPVGYRKVVDMQVVEDLPPVTPTQCIAAVRFSKEDLREICNEHIEIECIHGTCKDCKHWKDSDGVYRRGIGAESKCPINIKEVYEGNFYCKWFEKRGSENGSN